MTKRRDFTDRVTYLLRAAVLRTARSAPGDKGRRTYGVLTVLAEEPGCSQGELAELLCVNRTVMVKLVDELEKDGLVRRAQATKDRRRNRLEVTAKGRVRHEQLEAAIEEGERGLTGSLGALGRDRMLGLLRDICPVRLPAALSQRLTYLLPQVHHRAQNGAIGALAPLGIFPRHYGALAAILDAPGCSQLHVAKTFGVSEPTAAEVVSDLEERQLVRRVVDPEDGRMYRLTTTSAGAALARRAAITLSLEEASLLEPLEDVEVSDLLRLLRALHAESNAAGR
ncbi:MAG TPA: MarR family transcriptional regulator [Polyangiaceae bacterium]|nr:MarR family transcriptional regulator [Polyangiaceae bacterium]